MTLWKLTLAYDGTPYHGWQVQPGLPTIQGMLSEAIHGITGERVLPQGSGRTDTGVHALGQVASFALGSPIPAANLHRALNRCLPPSIRVLTTEIAPPGFHARHSALRKTYEYRIFPLRSGVASGTAGRSGDHDSDRICAPTLAPFVWPCPWPLDLEMLNQAARHVLGAHDFTTFAATDPDQSSRAAETPTEDGLQTVVDGDLMPAPAASRSLIRTIHDSGWGVREDLLIYTVTGSGFLHHMVRNLVGTFVQAGAHRLDPDSIPTLLAARSRSVSGPTAPATGLFLVEVEYSKPLLAS